MYVLVQKMPRRYGWFEATGASIYQVLAQHKNGAIPTDQIKILSTIGDAAPKLRVKLNRAQLHPKMMQKIVDIKLRGDRMLAMCTIDDFVAANDLQALVDAIADLHARAAAAMDEDHDTWDTEAQYIFSRGRHSHIRCTWISPRRADLERDRDALLHDYAIWANAESEPCRSNESRPPPEPRVPAASHPVRMHVPACVSTPIRARTPARVAAADDAASSSGDYWLDEEHALANSDQHDSSEDAEANAALQEQYGSAHPSDDEYFSDDQ